MMENDPSTMEFPDLDPASLPTSLELPLGELILEIKSLSVKFTNENETGEKVTNPKSPRFGQLKIGGKRTVVAQFTVDQPEELLGLPAIENFYIGSDDDPKAEKEGTWRRNATLLMKMFKVAHVGGKTLREYFAAAPGQKVGASVKLEKSKDPQYADKHRVRDYWEPGTKVVKVIDKDADMNAAMPPLPPTGSFTNDD